jgi:hypothetical protein
MWLSRTIGHDFTFSSKATRSASAWLVSPEALPVYQRTVALDDAGLFKRPDPAETWRRRDADPARQLDVGHASIGLKLVEDLPIDRIKPGFQIEVSLTICWCRRQL